MTPYKAMYGQAPSIVTFYIARSSKVNAIDSKLVNWDDILCLLKDNLQTTQHRMKQHANQQHIEWEF